MYKLAALLAGALLLPTASLAKTFTYSDYSVDGVGVNITSPNEIGGEAGIITLDTPSGPVSAWCVDIFDVLQPVSPAISPYEVKPLAGGEPGVPLLSNLQIGIMGRLMSMGDHDTSPDQFAAIQLAIWKVEYGAPFAFNGVSSGIVTEMNNFINIASLSPIPHGDVVAFVDVPAAPNQTLANVIPEPSTWAMLMLGFGGLAFFGIRRHNRERLATI